jgi:rhodanese-related sulfurtransferase/rubrerythrin
MNSDRFFTAVPGVSADQVRTMAQEKNFSEYNLIDVRQSAEYEQVHIAGAKLIPLAEIPGRAGEIDRSKPTILYCRSGNRSRAAAAHLLNAGFTDVVSMDGGILAWQGFVASGPPAAEMAYFSSAEKPEELIALAWLLEEGSRRFYAGVEGSLADTEAAGLFRNLVRSEEHHTATLLALYREATGDKKADKIPDTLFSGKKPGELMEGGMSVARALEWIRGKSVVDVLDLSLALESHAYDLYVKMEREMHSDAAQRTFRVLAVEEKGHLERLAAMLDKQRLPETGK